MSIEYTPGPLLDTARHTPTALWNNSSDPSERAQSISFGGVGATCNPTIAYTCINQRRDVWLPRIAELAKEMPDVTESEIDWQVVRELSLEAAKLLEPIFEAENGHNGRLSMQTDPRLARSTKALADQAEEFHNLAKNIIVKTPATSVGVEVYDTQGSVRRNFERFNELEVCIGDGGPTHGYTRAMANPAWGQWAHFQPAIGTSMGFDDMKVIEAQQFLSSIATSTQFAPSAADSWCAAEVDEAVVASAADGAWHAVPRVSAPPPSIDYCYVPTDVIKEVHVQQKPVARDGDARSAAGRS